MYDKTIPDGLSLSLALPGLWKSRPSLDRGAGLLLPFGKPEVYPSRPAALIRGVLLQALNSFDTSTVQADVSESFLLLPDRGGARDYIFGALDGFFAVDTPNGALLALKKAATKAFDPSSAGSYRAMFYQKIGAVGLK